MVRTSVTLRAVLLCSYQVLTSSVRYQTADPRQNEIYLLSICEFEVDTRRSGYQAARDLLRPKWGFLRPTESIPDRKSGIFLVTAL